MKYEVYGFCYGAAVQDSSWDLLESFDSKENAENYILAVKDQHDDIEMREV